MLNKYGYRMDDSGKPLKLWRIVENYGNKILITDDAGNTQIVNAADFWQVL
jgi:hypothetical protein